jgi:hypothetical protein
MSHPVCTVDIHIVCSPPINTSSYLASPCLASLKESSSEVGVQ